MLDRWRVTHVLKGLEECRLHVEQIWSVYIVDPSLGPVHVGDSFRGMTLILRYILQCWFIRNLIVVACTG